MDGEVGIVSVVPEEPYQLFDKVPVTNIYYVLNVIWDANGIHIIHGDKVVSGNVDVVVQLIKIYGVDNLIRGIVFDNDILVTRETVDLVIFELVIGIVLNCNLAFYLNELHQEKDVHNIHVEAFKGMVAMVLVRYVVMPAVKKVIIN